MINTKLEIVNNLSNKILKNLVIFFLFSFFHVFTLRLSYFIVKCKLLCKPFQTIMRLFVILFLILQYVRLFINYSLYYNFYTISHPTESTIMHKSVLFFYQNNILNLKALPPVLLVFHLLLLPFVLTHHNLHSQLPVKELPHG